MFSGCFDPHTQCDTDVRTNAKPHVRRGARHDFSESLAWWALELDEYFGRSNRQLLPGAYEDGHSGPSPTVNIELDGNEGLDRGTGGDTRDRAIAVILSAHHRSGRNGTNCFQQNGFLITDRFVIFAGRRLHREVGKDLQHMILNDVAQRARFVIEPAPVLDA